VGEEQKRWKKLWGREREERGRAERRIIFFYYFIKFASIGIQYLLK
jgi:hypothetical protein